MGVFSSVLTGSLQGIAERPLPCNYNVIQFVCAVSRRQHGFNLSGDTSKTQKLCRVAGLATRAALWVRFGGRDQANLLALVRFMRPIYVCEQ